MLESRIIANNILWDIFNENLVKQRFKISPHALKVEPKHLSTFSKTFDNKIEFCYKCFGKILVRDIVYIYHTGYGFKPLCPNCDNPVIIKKAKNNKKKDKKELLDNIDD